MKKKMMVMAAVLAMTAVMAGCSADAANGNAASTTAATLAAAKEEKKEESKEETEAKAEETTKAEGGEAAEAIDWPKETITFHVPGAAGGATDTAARIVCDYIEKVTGGTVVVQNHTTGAGAVMLETLRTNENPDYNLAMCGSQNILLLQGGKYEYDVRDTEQFTIISRMIVGAHSNALVCSKNAPFKTYDEFVAYAKEHPGEVRIVVSSGSLSEVYTNIICSNEGLDVKLLEASTNDQVTNVLGGMADCFVSSYNTLAGYDGTGELIPLVFINEEKEEAYPDVPSFAEIGLADKLASGGQFVIAAAGIDPAVVAYLNQILPGIMEDPEFTERAATTNNVLEVLDQEHATETYHNFYDMFNSVR